MVNLLSHWRAGLLILVAAALWYSGYHTGSDTARARGDAALAAAQHQYTAEKNQQLQQIQQHFEQQVVAANQAEHDYLQQIKSLETDNVRLKKQVADVTRVWQDEKGKRHAINCVFTDGFVQQYNHAFGASEAAAVARRTGRASGTAAAADTRLRDSGVSQRDVLASATANGLYCRKLAAQVSGLLNYIETLHKEQP